jgi:pyruvate dehydrogenase E2 component (dihydrolipoamide acetyltransferase)
VRDVEKKSILQLADELSTIAQRARDRKLTLDEMRGGSITITNLGGIGGTSFTPIVNWPEVAILGISRAKTELNFDRAAQGIPTLMLPLSLSYDHRLIDGADGARFLKWITDAIEQPFLMELEGK